MKNLIEMDNLLVNTYKEAVLELENLGLEISTNNIDRVFINPKLTNAYGVCHYFNKGKNFKIAIGLKAFVSIDELKNTLIHELLHTLAPWDGHTGKWKRLAEKVNRAYGYNIKRATSFSELVNNDVVKMKESFNYLVKCEKCEKIIGKTKKCGLITHTEIYGCKCGGKLTRIK